MTLDAMTIRMIFNVVIVLIVVGGLTGFWYLVLKLLQPEKKIWWWLGYIVVVIGLGVSMRHFIINQVELFGTSSYLPLQLLRTETYGFMMGILLAIPVLLVMVGIQWLVNRNSKSVEPEMGSSRRKFFQTAAVAIPAATSGVPLMPLSEGKVKLRSLMKRSGTKICRMRCDIIKSRKLAMFI